MIGYLDYMSLRDEVSEKCKWVLELVIWLFVVLLMKCVWLVLHVMLTSCFLRSFFTPKVFTKLLKDDPLGRYEVISSINISKIHFSIYSFRVSITQLFSYIMRKGTLTTISTIKLYYHDSVVTTDAYWIKSIWYSRPWFPQRISKLSLIVCILYVCCM